MRLCVGAGWPGCLRKSSTASGKHHYLCDPQNKEEGAARRKPRDVKDNIVTKVRVHNSF